MTQDGRMLSAKQDEDFCVGVVCAHWCAGAVGVDTG